MNQKLVRLIAAAAVMTGALATVCVLAEDATRQGAFDGVAKPQSEVGNKKPRWTLIVTEFLDEGSANEASQLMSMGKQMGWYGDTDRQGVNIKAIQTKPISIKAVIAKFGKPDAVKAANLGDADSKNGAKKDYDSYEYDDIISLCVPKGGDVVEWIEAPVGYWVEGIQKKAARELQTGDKTQTQSKTAPQNKSSFIEERVSSRPNQTKPASSEDVVEQFIRMTEKTQDGHDTVNACMFKPDDPRFNYEHKKRTRPVPDSKVLFGKVDPIASFNNLSAGPNPTKQTDQIEARMLMDKGLVGDRYWRDMTTNSGEMLLVFIDSPSMTMPDARKKYGQPSKTIHSGESQLHFYGRMILVETAGGKIHAVLRRGIKST